MNFLFPNFLYALFALIIPIIIHLFNFQKFKVVYFSNFQFLQNINMQTKKHSNIKKWLILIIRMLFFSALVIVFARPITKSNNISSFKKNNVAIFIDNSYSMENIGENNSLINQAKQTASQIVNYHSHNDNYYIFTSELIPEQFRNINKDECDLIFDNIKISNISERISNIVSKIGQSFMNSVEVNNKIFIISDFQKQLFDIENFKIDSNISLFLIPLENKKAENIYIDTCWLDNPIIRAKENISLKAKIVNSSSQDLKTIPISLNINNVDIASTVVDIKSNSYSIISLNFIINNSGSQKGFIKVVDNGRINFDDKLFLSFEIKNSINILEIYEQSSNKYLKSLFETDSVFNFTSNNSKNINYSLLNNQNLIILSDLSNIETGLENELKKYSQNGGNICFVINKNIDENSINRYLKRNINCELLKLDTAKLYIEKVNFLNKMFTNVFNETTENINLPFIKKHFPITNTENFEKLFSLNNRSIVFGSTKYNNSNFYLLSFGLDDEYGNFHKHPLFVPTFLNMALLNNIESKLFYKIGDNNIIKIKNQNNAKDNIFSIKNVDNNFEFIPQILKSYNDVFLIDNNQKINSGIYDILYKKQVIESIAYNDNRNESNLTYYSKEQLSELIKKMNLKNISIIDYKENINKDAFNQINENIFLKLFILIALLLLLSEILIIRFL